MMKTVGEQPRSLPWRNPSGVWHAVCTEPLWEVGRWMWNRLSGQTQLFSHKWSLGPAMVGFRAAPVTIYVGTVTPPGASSWLSHGQWQQWSSCSLAMAADPRLWPQWSGQLLKRSESHLLLFSEHTYGSTWEKPGGEPDHYRLSF